MQTAWCWGIPALQPPSVAPWLPAQVARRARRQGLGSLLMRTAEAVALQVYATPRRQRSLAEWVEQAGGSMPGAQDPTTGLLSSKQHAEGALPRSSYVRPLGPRRASESGNWGASHQLGPCIFLALMVRRDGLPPR